jgi:hypothetical protein
MDHRRPARFSWNYDCGEIIADGLIYANGISFGLTGAVNDCDGPYLVGVLG